MNQWEYEILLKFKKDTPRKIIRQTVYANIYRAIQDAPKHILMSIEFPANKAAAVISSIKSYCRKQKIPIELRLDNTDMPKTGFSKLYYLKG